MEPTKTIYFTVTNDLSYDQRMQRICSTLAEAGYRVTLVGRKRKHSIPLQTQPFEQKRLWVGFEEGKFFYIAYNIRLFLFLLTKKMDVICAIDLDTIMPCLYASKIKDTKRFYDAHEIFTEMKEIVSRPKIQKLWLWVERNSVPKFQKGYTVNQFIVDELNRRYGVNYGIVRNLPAAKNDSSSTTIYQNNRIPTGKFFLYQGAVNEGRSFETLIPAMATVNAPLVIIGIGNFINQVKVMIAEHHLEEKVICLGALLPNELRQVTPLAFYGLTLFEATGINQYYSLANRFFDYIQGGIPQLCVGYPEYAAINQRYDIAHLTTDLSVSALSATMNKLLTDDVLYKRLRNNCSLAAKELSWEKEKQRLLDIYKNC